MGQACALNKDLKIMEDGDRSEIGERGVHYFVLDLACSVILTDFAPRSRCQVVRRLEVRTGVLRDEALIVNVF